MKKRIMLPLLLEIFAITSTMTVLAAPQTMSDGTVFDAEFYAQTYPDVASVYGTTNTDILYQHYVQFGKAEGRLATSPLIHLPKTYRIKAMRHSRRQRDIP